MKFLDTEYIANNFNYREFIPFLQNFFCQAVEVPERQHYSIPLRNKRDAALLLMPAWLSNHYVGTKVSNIFLDNTAIDLPTIQGLYLLMCANTGEVRCILDGEELTAKRTAASSALAAKYLSKTNTNSLLVIGTGKLCHELIRAHCTVNPITKVYIWGRDFNKSESKANSLYIEGVSIIAIDEKNKYLKVVDLVSCATLSKEPLVLGDFIRPGTHIDLVGSYTPDAREADDEMIRKASIFIDTASAIDESGDLHIPLRNGIFQLKDVKANLSELCKNTKPGRQNTEEVTIFKSVGYALEDLAAACYLFEKHTKQEP